MTSGASGPSRFGANAPVSEAIPAGVVAPVNSPSLPPVGNATPGAAAHFLAESDRPPRVSLDLGLAERELRLESQTQPRLDPAIQADESARQSDVERRGL